MQYNFLNHKQTYKIKKNRFHYKSGKFVCVGGGRATPLYTSVRCGAFSSMISFQKTLML